MYFLKYLVGTKWALTEHNMWRPLIPFPPVYITCDQSLTVTIEEKCPALASDSYSQGVPRTSEMEFIPCRPYSINT